MITNLGYKIFIMFATVNIGAMATFSLLIPETKGKSLEEMDILFGAVSQDERQAYIDRRQKCMLGRGRSVITNLIGVVIVLHNQESEKGEYVYGNA